MNENLSRLHEFVDEFIRKIGDYPKDQYSGKGIVTTSYDKEFESSWVLLNELKRLNVDLPVEIFHKEGELSEKQINIISNIDAKFKVKLLQDNVTGWSIKPFSILQSSFEEVIWMDSDNCPVRNIEFLFDDIEYKEKGSLFWRDVCNEAFNYPTAQTWEVFNVPYNDCEKFETGQLVLNKKKCWKEFQLCLLYTMNSNLYYQFVHGDTGTFKFAFLYLHKHKPYYRINYHSDSSLVPFGFIPYGPFHVGEPNMYGKWGGGCVLAQRDREGEVLFNHRTINKFKLSGSVYQRHVINEKYYHEHMEELKKIYGE
jgi:alpha 1,2-mannosyltransferase